MDLTFIINYGCTNPHISAAEGCVKPKSSKCNNLQKLIGGFEMVIYYGVVLCDLQFACRQIGHNLAGGVEGATPVAGAAPGNTSANNE